MKGFWLGLHDPGKGGCAFLAGYDHGSSRGEAGAGLPRDDEFSLSLGEVWVLG